jgi:transposase
MIVQKSLNKKMTHKKIVIGTHPIIQWFIDKLRIPEIIASYIIQDARFALSVEKTLCVLIHNILTTPKPMYEMSDWVSPIGEEHLGLNLGEGMLLNDDRIGKSFDLFYNGRHQDVFFRLALRAIKVFQLSCTNIHQDTTSVTLKGKYSDWNAEEILTYGRNKDYRSDLKQLVLGLSVTGDGAVPLVHRVYDGNQTDDTLHVKNHQRLVALLKRTDFIYTADCKLATDSNLNKISGCGGLFITIMPRTWKEDAEFRKLVRGQKITWKHILSRKNNRNPDGKKDRYYAANGKYESKQKYTIYWIKSTQKAEQDVETRERQIQKSIEALKEFQTKLNKRKLKTRSGIKRGIEELLKANHCNGLISFEIQSERKYKKKFKKPGRPSFNNNFKLTWKPFFSITFIADQEAITQEKMTDGVFPLITNIGKEKYSPKKVLEIYKFQPFIEKNHTRLKSWQLVVPAYLKKGKRIVAYIHIHVMALIVSSLIERQIRKAMRNEKINSIPIYPEGKPCESPTLRDIVRLFNGVEKYEVENGEEVTLFPAKLSKTQKEVLRLLEIPTSKYQ